MYTYIIYYNASVNDGSVSVACVCVFVYRYRSIKTHTVGWTRVRAAERERWCGGGGARLIIYIILCMALPWAPDNNPSENANYFVTMGTVKIDIGTRFTARCVSVSLLLPILYYTALYTILYNMVLF